MKVLNVNDTVNKVTGGGTAERTIQVSRFLAMAGHSVSIVAVNTGGLVSGEGQLKNVKLVKIPSINKRFNVPNPAIRLIYNEVKNADVVHLMCHWTMINVFVYLFIRLLRKKYVVCPAGALVITGNSQWAKRIYNLLIGKSIIRNANLKVAVSSNEIEVFKDYGVPSEQITVIPNGIDPKEYEKKNNDEFRSIYSLPKKKIILFVGRLNEIKGTDLLVEAFVRSREALGDYILVVAGPDVGLKEELKKVVSDHKANNEVHFIGYINSEQKSLAYNACEFLVIPSRSDAMSIVVLEAGITEKPVVITDRCGFDDIEQINAGRVVGVSVSEISQGILDLSNRENELQEMGRRLKDYVQMKFLWTSIADMYSRHYEEIYDEDRK